MNTLVNDGKNPLDRRAVMLYFRLVVFDLLAQPSHIELMLATVNPLLEFEKAA